MACRAVDKDSPWEPAETDPALDSPAGRHPEADNPEDSQGKDSPVDTLVVERIPAGNREEDTQVAVHTEAHIQAAAAACSAAVVAERWRFGASADRCWVEGCPWKVGCWQCQQSSSGTLSASIARVTCIRTGSWKKAKKKIKECPGVSKNCPSAVLMKQCLLCSVPRT